MARVNMARARRLAAHDAMECFFINLASATPRRAFLEASFEAHAAEGWYLNRVEATAADEMRKRAVPGGLRDNEKACFTSHRRAIEEATEAPGHALILEDDACFGPSTCARIEAALAQLPAEGWDLVYTDLVIFDPVQMTQLITLRRSLGPGAMTLFDLASTGYCGATAYVVHETFKPKLAAMLAAEPALETAYDIYLRELVRTGRARGFAAFPFPTTLSALGDTSQIQAGDAADVVWNAFRRLVWADRDVAAATIPLDALSSDFTDPESAAFARILGAALAPGCVKP
jgi:GR25 family glycosyltransferase involved in LPS biosynthesis